MSFDFRFQNNITACSSDDGLGRFMTLNQGSEKDNISGGLGIEQNYHFEEQQTEKFGL